MLKAKSGSASNLSTPDIGVILVLFGAVFSGLRPLFAQLLNGDGVSAIVTALYCYLGSALIFLPIGIRGNQHTNDQKRAALLAVISGLFVGVGGAAYFEALSRLPVATVTLIYFTYPAMVVLLLSIIHRKRPPHQAWIGILCVLIGIFFIVGRGIENTENLPTDLSS